MAFQRTSAGLTNQHLFYNVDAVLYVEGGTSYSIEEILRNNYDDYSVDVLFWRNLLNKYFPNKTFKLKAVGSKSSVDLIAQKIIDEDLEFVYAAMDKEFDDELGSIKGDHRIYYTYGYSWENDVWNVTALKSIFERFDGQDTEESVFKIPLNKFLKEIRIAVIADGFLFNNPGPSFFSRPKGYLKFVECSGKCEPHVKKDEIRSKLSADAMNRSTLNGFARRKNIESKKNCFGHLFGDYCCHLLRYLLKSRLGVGGLSNDVLSRMAIVNAYANFEASTKKHYDMQFQ